MPVETGKPSFGRDAFRVGEWLVEPLLNRVSDGDTTTQLELKVMDVLVCLVERAGEVVSRQEIIDRVWATEFIADNTLTHAITEIRNAFGDDARNPSFIETIHRRGYRLIAPVERASSDHAAVSRVARFPVPERQDERSPYPGLAAFTQQDAEYFFGREEEVAQMWRKLTSRRLLGVIGPSGVGKSSFLRAGVIPARPEGWGILFCQPGEAPLAALARALVPEFAGDVEALAQLVEIRDGDRAMAMMSRWRDRHDQAVLIIDQFEELFTLNEEDGQQQSANLIGRLVTDSGLHVLLAMRDDYLYRCHTHAPLRPLFEDLAVLEQPGNSGLHRALVEPATRMGYRFEDEDLPGEMIAEVEGERGTLPMLAFAVARLWEERDRKNRLLTRHAYEEIGGVGGALARHAEMTLKAVGDEGLPIVREIFRNLVTAEGTRAVREWSELLSVFDTADIGSAGIKPSPAKKGSVGDGFIPSRELAEHVLRRLIDARLLTSFEEEVVEGDGRPRVEVVHEALLSSWPRMVRWQTQDADSAQFRDQLRQAARTWDMQERPDDLLWSGSPYREFASWRERYPGGLTETEEAFANAMHSHAKRRRRRRNVVTAALMILAVVVATFFGILWRRSDLEARRAEAQKLIALGQLDLDGYPTAALAHATASLEIVDTPEARGLALDSLWRGPPASIIQPSVVGDYWSAAFSPDGRWLAAANFEEDVLVYPSSGGLPLVLDGHEAVGGPRPLFFDATSHYLATGAWYGSDNLTRVWSLPEASLFRTFDLDRHGWYFTPSIVGEDYITVKWPSENRDQVQFLAHSLADGADRLLGERKPVANRTIDPTLDWRIDPNGQWLAEIRGDSVFVLPFDQLSDGPAHLAASHDEPIVDANFTADGRRLITEDKSHEIRIWSLEQPPSLIRVLQTPSGVDRGRSYLWSHSSNAADGTMIARCSPGERTASVWKIEGPPDAVPTLLTRSDVTHFEALAFHPGGQWLALANGGSLSLWPLSWARATVLRGIEKAGVYRLCFTPDGDRLLSASGDGVTIWPLNLRAGTSRIPGDGRGCYGLAVDPTGRRFARYVVAGPVILEPLSEDAGHETTVLFGSDQNPVTAGALAFDQTGTKLAAGSHWGSEAALLQILDLDSGDYQTFPLQGEGTEALPHKGCVWDLRFAPDGTLYSGGFAGVRRWDTASGTYEWVLDANPDSRAFIDLSADGRTLLVLSWTETGSIMQLMDLVRNDRREITSHGSRLSSIALDPSGKVIVTGDADGVIRASTVDGEPHLLVGHEGRVEVVAISPDGRWIASAAGDEIRLWPMPDLSKPPLQTLRHDQLITKLHTLTNLRVVRDEDSRTGWTVEVGPFPGWKTAPTW